MKLCLITGFMFFGLSAFAQQDDTSSHSKKKTAIISFQLNSDVIDWSFMDNAETKIEIERLFTNKLVIDNVDSLLMQGFASPEGNYFYNLALSDRRLNAVKKYISKTYPNFNESKARYHSLGADWEGLLKLVVEDLNVPYRSEVMRLIASDIDPQKKENQLRQIGGGETHNYMKDYVFPKLRAATALVIFYPEHMETIFNPIKLDRIDSLPNLIVPVVADKVPIMAGMDRGRGYRYIRPIAIKTNLLFDVATLFNVEVEIPIRKRFSIMAEYTFPWWGGLGNRGGVSPFPVYSENYTIQMLYAGLEGRYWFPRGKKLNDKATRWGDYNALNGWFIGIYGGAGLYDFQFGRDKKGIQGDLYVAAGLSGGYAHPIGKHFHMEYSLGVGYLSTKYYKYTGRVGEKVVDILENGQYDYRKQNWIGPTKLKVSLVWIPRFKVNNR